MRLEGRTALVTGGASGFGAGIARKFIAEGASVMIADIDAGAAEAMAGVLGASWVAADVGDDAGVAPHGGAGDWARSDASTSSSTTPGSPTCRRRSKRSPRPTSTGCSGSTPSRST